MNFLKLNLGTVFIIDCDPPYDVVTIPRIPIITPNYPSFYESNLDCQVTVTFEGKVSIIFDDFFLEQAYKGSCQNDWLEVHDGDSSDSEIMGEKLCGELVWGFPIESSGNSITLVFHSDEDYTTNRGFKILTRQGRLYYTKIRNAKLDH